MKQYWIFKNQSNPIQKRKAKISEIPSYRDFQSINYYLLVAREITGDNGSCFSETVERICQLRVFYGKPINFRKTEELSIKLNFISRKGKNIIITKTGVDFIALNKDITYELSHAQVMFLAENYIFKGSWRSKTRELFLKFKPNHKVVTFEFSLVENPFPKKYMLLFDLLRKLNVIVINEGNVIVCPPYVDYVKAVRAGKIFSLEELRKLLDSDEKLGLLAEEAVLAYEKRRLKLLGRIPESELVRKISQLDVLAGYDIESFDGNKPGVTPNRFIEVKASRQSEIRFYWSINEVKKAKELKSNYWIYFIGSYKQGKSDDIKPIMIQNPFSVINKEKKYKMLASKYLVEENK